MIVQCELCSTKFKLDDAKVKDEGVRVRCSKCRHIFVVRKEQVETADDTDFDSFLNGLVKAGPQGSNLSEEDIPNNSEKPVMESVSDDSNNENSELETPFPQLISDPFAFDSAPETDESDGVRNGNKLGPGFDDPDTAFFNEISAPAADIPLQFSVAEDNQESSDSETFSFPYALENDQNTDSMFETVPPFESNTLNQGHTETAEPDEPKDTQEPDTTIVENQSEGLRSGAVDGISWDISFPDTTNKTEPFSSSGNLSKEPDLHQKLDSPVEPQLSWEILDTSADEPPPPFLTTRKLSGSRLPLFLAVISVISVIALAGAGFYTLNKGPAVFDKLGIGGLARLIVAEKGAEGGVSIRNTSSEFISNTTVGELFVIKGETLNANSRPVASIQLKATIYNSKGVSLLNRMVYCGNTLTMEQLTSLPMNKLETVMGNQFGDSLSNIGLQPGKAIPFVVVFSVVPKDAAEFGIEVVGSTAEGAIK
jgi:predicted Zn finger-like uncharacterized protein